jgi:hypothetical protein
MRYTAALAKNTTRPLVLSVQLLFVGLMAFGCVQQQPVQPAPPPPPTVQAAPQTGVTFLGYLTGKHGTQLSGHDIRNTPPFSTAYRALLRRNKLKDSWLTHFNGPSTPVYRVAINGAPFLQVCGCKAHSCTANHITVLYSHEEKAIYARLTQDSEELWLGDPPDAIKQAFTQLKTIEPPR